jgi:hypothetical protein
LSLFVVTDGCSNRKHIKQSRTRHDNGGER